MKNPYKTILVISIGLLVAYLIVPLKWLLYLNVCVGCFSLLHSKIAEVIEFVWDKLTQGLGFVFQKIVLSIFFYLVLTPIALLSRMFSRSSSFYHKRSATSLFQESIRSIGKESFEKPW